MIINHNMNALNAHRNMTANTTSAGKSMEKLSSGLRINRAGDDAAGLAISEKMRGQIRGLDQASRNAQDSISLIQTAEGALNETHSILQRMRELAVQSSNDTNNADDRGEIQKEVDQLAQEINRIARDTQFNEKNLLDGTYEGKFHIGANEGQDITVGISSTAATTLGVNADKTTTELNGLKFTNSKTGEEYTITIAATTNGSKLGATINDGEIKIQLGATAASNSLEKIIEKIEGLNIDGLSVELAEGATNTDLVDGKTNATTKLADPSNAGIDVSSQETASKAITSINEAIKSVSTQRSNLGAYQNRLEHTINNLNTSSENLTAAESRVRDVDMAKEMMTFSKNNILQQAAQAMLAQANQQPQGVLQLLR